MTTKEFEIKSKGGFGFVVFFLIAVMMMSMGGGKSKEVECNLVIGESYNYHTLFDDAGVHGVLDHVEVLTPGIVNYEEEMIQVLDYGVGRIQFIYKDEDRKTEFTYALTIYTDYNDEIKATYSSERVLSLLKENMYETADGYSIHIASYDIQGEVIQVVIDQYVSSEGLRHFVYKYRGHHEKDISLYGVYNLNFILLEGEKRHEWLHLDENTHIVDDTNTYIDEIREDDQYPYFSVVEEDKLHLIGMALEKDVPLKLDLVEDHPQKQSHPVSGYKGNEPELDPNDYPAYEYTDYYEFYSDYEGDLEEDEAYDIWQYYQNEE